jgi:hypothetical protein
VFTEALDEKRRCGLSDYANVICLPQMKANGKRTSVGELKTKKTKQKGEE